MRKYSSYDLIRFRNFSNENPGLKPMELIEAYNEKYPELSAKEKLINLSRALGNNGLYKALTGNDIPKPESLIDASGNEINLF